MVTGHLDFQDGGRQADGAVQELPGGSPFQSCGELCSDESHLHPKPILEGSIRTPPTRLSWPWTTLSVARSKVGCTLPCVSVIGGNGSGVGYARTTSKTGTAIYGTM